jgi:hypothetical protein
MNYEHTPYNQAIKWELSEEDQARLDAGESLADIIFPKSKPKPRWRRLLDEWRYRISTAWGVLRHGSEYIE